MSQPSFESLPSLKTALNVEGHVLVMSTKSTLGPFSCAKGAGIMHVGGSRLSNSAAQIK